VSSYFAVVSPTVGMLPIVETLQLTSYRLVLIYVKVFNLSYLEY